MDCTFISCPFCGETDFDLVGLKLHLMIWPCEQFLEIKDY